MKTLPIIILFTAVSITGYGQCPSNKGQLEIAASYGSVTSDQVNIGTVENTKTLTYNSGIAFVTARYFLYSCLAVGFAGGSTNERGQYADAFNPKIITSTFKQGVTTIALEVYYVYTFRKYVEVYTFIGAGPAFTTVITVTNPTLYTPGNTITTSSDGLKAQYTPIGVRVGGRLGGFAELGFGYKGLINAGISYKFGRPCWWKL